MGAGEAQDGHKGQGEKMAERQGKCQTKDKSLALHSGRLNSSARAADLMLPGRQTKLASIRANLSIQGVAFRVWSCMLW